MLSTVMNVSPNSNMDSECKFFDRGSFLGQKCCFQILIFKSSFLQCMFLAIGTLVYWKIIYDQMELDLWNFDLQRFFYEITKNGDFWNWFFKNVLCSMTVDICNTNSICLPKQHNEVRMQFFLFGVVFGAKTEKWWFLKYNFQKYVFIGQEKLKLVLLFLYVFTNCSTKS